MTTKKKDKDKGRDLVVRPPPEAPPAALDAFVSGKASTPAPSGQPSVAGGQPSTAARAGERTGRGRVARAGGREAAQIAVYVPPQVAEKLRRHAFETGKAVSDICAPAIIALVAELPEPSKG